MHDENFSESEENTCYLYYMWYIAGVLFNAYCLDSGVYNTHLGSQRRCGYVFVVGDA